jgi:hypothetical protein
MRNIFILRKYYGKFSRNGPSFYEMQFGYGFLVYMTISIVFELIFVKLILTVMGMINYIARLSQV